MKRIFQNITITFVVISGLFAIATSFEGHKNPYFVPGNYNDALRTAGQIKAKMPPPSETVIGKPWKGRNGISETVDEIMYRDRKHPFVYTGPHPTKEESEEFEHVKTENPDAPQVSEWPEINGDNISKNQKEKNNPQTVGTTFDGPQLSESGYIPPDNNGDIGPTQFLTIANGRIKVYDRSGVLGALNTTTNNFFTTVTNSSGTSDPHVRYDRLTGRWFITMINVSTPNRILIAVSSGSIITGTTSFTFYYFQHDLVGTTPNSDTGGFADYDTFGLDNFALYIGVNVFNAAGNAVLGTTGFVVNKSSLIAGTLVVTPFRQLTNGSNTGPWTPQGVNNDDPSATEGYFIGVDFMVYSQLDIRRITNPGGVPSISGNIILTVPSTYAPVPQQAQGTPTSLDALDDRLFAAHVHKNKISGTLSLWTAHNIRVNSSGVSSSSGNRNGSRWYEITNLTTTPTLNQSGTLYDPAASGPRGFWIPSVAMSGQGHMVLGCSTAGNNYRAEIAASGRLYSDVLGLTQPYSLVQSSTSSYNIPNSNPQRWGDFSQVNIDPNDDMTMWTIQQYCNSTNSWSERVIQLKAPPPATVTSATSVTTGLPSVNSIVTGTVVSGSGFFDAGFDAGGPGYTNHISATVSGGVTVNSITFNSPTQVTLNLNTSSAPIGFKDITITNPDGQNLTSSGILQVTSPLPVTMSSFSSIVNKRDVNLYWTTTYEINNSGFEIERKNYTNSSEWMKVGFISGAGTTNSPKNYEFKDVSLNTGIYQYKLKQVDYNGNFEYFNLNNIVNIGSPDIFGISQNYPNPSNPVSKIDYQLPENGNIKLVIYDLSGKEVNTLVNGNQEAGYYSVKFDGTSLASGIYFYRIIFQNGGNLYIKTLKLVLIK